MFIMPTWMEVTTVLISLLWIHQYVALKRTLKHFKRLGIDNPKPSLIYGNLLKDGFLKSVGAYYKEYSHKRVFGIFLGSYPMYVVTDLDLARQVLVKDFNNFVNRFPQPSGIKSIQLSLLSLRDDHWRRVRATVSPTFTTGKLKLLSGHIEHASNLFVECLMEKHERNEEVELKELISCLTMDLIAKVGFGVEIDSLKDPTNPFVKQAQKFIRKDDIHQMIFWLSLCRFIPIFWFAFPFIVTTKPLREAVQFFDKFTDVAFKNRKEEKVKGPNDFLQLMVNAEEIKEAGDKESTKQSGGLTMDEVKGQALIFILAGYETVSTVLSFTLFLLAINPECCEKAQEEIDEKIGRHAKPNYENIQKLEYLDMCICEAIRMFPPGFALDRQVKDDIEIEGFKFTAGASVTIPVYQIHHDPNIWSEPDKFIPERFTPENRATRHPFAYLPFGQGPRNCVAMRLAQLELGIIIGSILQRLTPVRCDKTVYPVTLLGLNLSAKDGLWVKLEGR